MTLRSCEGSIMRILLGGSPCTYWSIAQKNNRETEASGMGWELFKNYLIAKEKFKPDYFLYENNVSAAQPIKDEIKKQFGVWDGTFLMPYTDVRYIEINSALVAAQNRERFYVHNCGEVGQPEDRGILLKDVLESGCDLTGNEKSYTVTTRCNGAIPEDTLIKHRHNMVAEPIRVGEMPNLNGKVSNSQGNRIYSIDGKSVTQSAQGGGWGAKTGLYAVPVCVNSKIDGKQPSLADRIYDINGKATAVTTAFHPSIAEPIRVGAMPVNTAENGKSHTIKAQYYKNGIANFITNSGFDASAVAEIVTHNIATEFDSDGKPTKAYCYADGKIHTVYEVKDGKITIKGKKYPIKLPRRILHNSQADGSRVSQITDYPRMAQNAV